MALRPVSCVATVCLIPIVLIAPIALAFHEEVVFLGAVAASVLSAACGCVVVVLRRKDSRAYRLASVLRSFRRLDLPALLSQPRTGRDTPTQVEPCRGTRSAATRLRLERFPRRSAVGSYTALSSAIQLCPRRAPRIRSDRTRPLRPAGSVGAIP